MEENNNETNPQGNPPEGENNNPAEDNKGNVLTQADIDRAVEEAKAQWQSELEGKLTEAKSEGARLAKLSAEERKKEEDEKKQKQFEKERAEFERKSLIFEVQNQLSSKGLPTVFAPMIAGKDAEESKKALSEFEKEWNKSLEEAVTKRLGGRTPNIGGANNNLSEGDFFSIIKENQRI